MIEEMKAALATLGGVTASRLISNLVLLLTGMVVIHLAVNFMQKALEKSRLEKAAHALLLSLAKITLYVLLFLSVASGLGINITGIIALASTLTLSLSLSLQSLLANVMGGFTVLNAKPFRSGDYVEVAGLAGTVQEISVFYTKLSTPDNKLVSIPNSTVSNAQVVNYSSAGTRRVDIAISASYDCPTQKVLDALLEAAAVDKVLTNPAPFAGIVNYGQSTIDYTLRVWANAADYWDVFFALNKNVKDVFDARGVEMTYPHVNVHLDK